MKIKEVIFESIYRKISDDFVIIERTLKKECSDAYNAYKNGKVTIYRGGSQSKMCLEVNPQLGHRKSANVPNYYTVLMSQSPSFNSFPPRDKSLICSTNMEKADRYCESPTCYAVFPVNGTVIGVANKPDIWDTRVTINNYNSNLYYFVRDLALYFHGVCLSTIQEQIQYEKDHKLGNIYEQFMQLTPDELGFSVMDSGSFYKNLSRDFNSEVWFSAKAYMVNLVWLNIIDEPNKYDRRTIKNLLKAYGGY